jgi:Cys-tRNA synthase (O-phospho-L-seryl-tRNA:Cys-tRNA synthase)
MCTVVSGGADIRPVFPRYCVPMLLLLPYDSYQFPIAATPVPCDRSTGIGEYSMIATKSFGTVIFKRSFQTDLQRQTHCLERKTQGFSF